MDQMEFGLWARYVYELTGIALEPAKSYLIESRLEPLLKVHDCKSLGDLYHKSRMDRTGNIQKDIIDRITTKETLFFRDHSPFEMLKYKILPDMIDRKQRNAFSRLPISIRVWSAGCSTGQEVYSIAIALKEILEDMARCNISILGTDISGAAIARASSGTYSQLEIERGICTERLSAYFTRDGDVWKISDDIRGMATFRTMNLMQSFTDLGKFDMVFCRNVAIYFTLEDRKKLFQQIEKVLQDDGVLLIGSTESLTGIAPRFMPRRYLKSVFYQVAS
jgi:chemotaxis protein methyltransferase CheR